MTNMQKSQEDQLKAVICKHGGIGGIEIRDILWLSKTGKYDVRIKDMRLA